jgi:thiol-disulfide isomerase/thioredoxin
VSRRRLVLIAAGTAAVAAIVAAGVILAGGGEAAAPVPVAGDLPALGSVEETAGSGAVEASGIDPITGEAVSLADFEGTPVVLNFWASWCAPCREELPALIQLAERHPEVALVGVNYQDAAGDARALQHEIGFDWPNIGDPQGELGADFGLQGMPSTFFLDADHRIVAVVLGGTDLEGFEEGVALIAPAAT